MDELKSVDAKSRRQERVAHLIWGLFLIAAGVLLTLGNLGKIALGQPQRLKADYAVDGRADTRWSSRSRDPQWIAVDLGETMEIRRVTLRWEEAYARTYALEVSSDGTTWTPVQRVVDADGELDEHAIAATGRYFRVYGVKRATQYGYSLWDLEVYGHPASAGAEAADMLLSQGRPASSSSVEVQRFPYFAAYWPLLLIVLGLPALLAPKSPGDQLFGMVVAGAGTIFALRQLGYIPWTFAQTWPVLLVAGGLLLILQSWQQLGRRGEPGAAGTKEAR